MTGKLISIVLFAGIMIAFPGWAAEYGSEIYLIPDPVRYGEDSVEMPAGAFTFVLMGGVRAKGDAQDLIAVQILDDSAQLPADSPKLPPGKMLLWVKFSQNKTLVKPLRVVLIMQDGMSASIKAYQRKFSLPSWQEVALVRQENQKLITFEIEKLESLVFILP